MENQIIEKGDLVQFYDSDMANKDRDFSGENPKHYPLGFVVSVYDYKSFYGYVDKVCDIKIGNRISKAHFVDGVRLIEKHEKHRKA